jgi:hypothetical protein
MRLNNATFSNGTFSQTIACSSVPAGQTCGPNVGVKSTGFGSLVVPAAGLGGARTGNLVMRINF